MERVTYEGSHWLHLGTARSISVYARLLKVVEIIGGLAAGRKSIILIGLSVRVVVKAFLARRVESLVVVLAQMVRIDHRQHLRESLANSGDSFGWVPEGKLAPRKVVYPLTIEIDDVLCAAGA